MLDQRAGARTTAGAGTGSSRYGSLRQGRGRSSRPIGTWPFLGVAVASFGGPLALAALVAPAGVEDASASAGLAMLAAAIAFTIPLTIWLRYSEHASSSGGLYGFVEAAAGRRVALVQAAIWTISYVLYVVYTTVQIVYDLLPAVLPSEHRYQSVLALLIPLALVTVIVSGRTVALLVLGAVAISQLALAAVLDGVTLAHIPLSASSFGTSAPTGALVRTSAQTSLLYICGSLPLFLGGEVAAPARTIRRGLVAAFGITALVVTLAVAPLAAAPGFTHADVPGVTLVQQYVGAGLGRAIGVGIAVSIAGVMLCEYLALTRLLSAVSAWRPRAVALALGAVFIAAAPLTRSDPQGVYSALLEPSLLALWLSQLIVFAVYPRFAIRRGQRALPALTLSMLASAFAIYGLWLTISHPAS
ncbi:MAG: hypothetical protein WAK93_00610 [Solirubrobacteraceae bacterium]